MILTWMFEIALSITLGSVFTSQTYFIFSNNKINNKKSHSLIVTCFNNCKTRSGQLTT